MTQWLRGRTVFQRIALTLMVLALGAVIASYFYGGTSGGFVTLAFILFYIAFRKELLWRVRNRLLVTYFLSGVVPIFLIGLSLMLAAEFLLGQFATQRVLQDLEARIDSVRSTAQDLMLAASHGANVRDGNTEAFTYLPLDEQTLASFAPGVVSVARVLRDEDRTDVEFFPSRIFVVENGVRKEIVPAGLRPPRSWWDMPIAGMLPWKVQASSGKADILLLVTSRPSLLVAGATGRMAQIALAVLVVVGAFFLIVEAVSLFSSFRLTRAITRSVDDLYRGTLQVADGDFSHQIPVRGEHQLSELATSFNSMTAKIRQMIGEVKKKEKLDAELEIAREVQLRLFPKWVPKLKTLEMAGVCIPGRVVSLAVTITTMCVWTTDGQLSRSGTFREREFQRHC